MRKGFISAVFLLLFMNITLLIGVILYQAKSAMIILSDISKVNQDISREAHLINEINCILKNSQETEIYSTYQGELYRILIQGDRVDADFINENLNIHFLVDLDKKEIIQVILI